ncbi:MAG: hypothetical protein ABJF10_15160 [Chthoniobacter sp.]|uniref:hypothetical protein n=1 Tax=Chthoniobacter sp. TaxID=2510640 RepID=UPI0032AA6691
MSELLQTKVGEIKSAEVLALIDELEQACPVGSRNFVNSPLLFFLTQCVYPDGSGKRVPITTKFVAATVLEMRVGKLSEGPLRDLCGELATLSRNGLELFSGSRVYMLLNKTLPKFTAKGPTEKQRRWDTVVRQRRANRG